MEGRQRRSFTDGYKRQAVDLVASSGRSIGSVAKELGLRDSVLRRWVELRGAGREPTAASRRPTPQATLPSADHARLPPMPSPPTESWFAIRIKGSFATWGNSGIEPDKG
jgi:transposase-like protein